MPETTDLRAVPTELPDSIGTGNEMDSRELVLFRSLDTDNDQRVFLSDLIRALADVGLRADDRRLTESMAALNTYLGNIAEHPGVKLTTGIPQARFARAIRYNILLIERALQGSMTIPDFPDFCDDVREIYEATLANRSGKPANHIPQLDLPEPEVDQYGVAVCTIDGQRFSIGDSQEFFSVQSTAKPIMYCLALEEHGVEKVHQHVGQEPSGARFNELTLNKNNQPHNPLINAGAIMCCSLIKLKEKEAKLRQDKLTEMDRRGWAGTRLDYLMER